MQKNDENVRQHLEFIQNVITRMNTNSFQIKELTILLITACLAIYAADKVALMLLIPILPTIILWFLDSYYLQQERKFRGVYNDMADIADPKIYDVKLYDMPIHRYTPDKKNSFSFWNVFTSKTIFWFYFPLIVVAIFFFLLVKINSILVILN